LYGFGESLGAWSSNTTFFSVELTAKIHAYGGFIIAEKLCTSNIPMFDIVNVPPLNSYGFNFFSLALPARSLASDAIYSSPFKLVASITGVIRPCSV
jgi:hypothetical protein